MWATCGLQSHEGGHAKRSHPWDCRYISCGWQSGQLSQSYRSRGLPAWLVACRDCVGNDRAGCASAAARHKTSPWLQNLMWVRKYVWLCICCDCYVLQRRLAARPAAHRPRLGGACRTVNYRSERCRCTCCMHLVAGLRAWGFLWGFLCGAVEVPRTGGLGQCWELGTFDGYSV